MWNLQSSQIDWCEDNWIISNYIVEFLNTISNIPILLLAFKEWSEWSRNGINDTKISILYQYFIMIPF